jgi:exosortase N
VLSAVAILWIGMELPERKITSERFATEVNVPVGFSSEVMPNGVVKMSNEEALIYLKPIAEFFSGEHTPLFCWRGSGYQFRHIRELPIGAHVIYCGEMIRPDGKLWTAWWYSNGEVQTIDQFDWRGRMMRGEKDFLLINVTAADEQTMLKYTRKLIEESFDPIAKTR